MASRRRTFQIAEKIRMIIAGELLRTADPRFHLVTITSVVVSTDMRYAKVYWVVSGNQERVAEVTEAFQGADHLFRRSVAKDLGVKFVPEIKFFYDDTLDVSGEVEELFERIAAEREKESV